MPVDLDHSRHSRQGTLGVALVWTCPSCGKQNEGRRIEQGCLHCGAGDPIKATTTPPASPAVEEVTHAEQAVGRTAPIPGGGRIRQDPATEAAARPLRILRMVEYLITPGADAQQVLRNSLVGTLTMAWGTITATIVDSIDSNQEDRLRLARLQPGVWLANPEAMKPPGKLQTFQPPMGGGPISIYAEGPPPIFIQTEETHAMTPDPPRMGPTVATDTGIARRAPQIAQMLEALGGPALCNTLACALAAMLPELSTHAPGHFLSEAEGKALMEALFAEIPDGWEEALDQAAAPVAAPLVNAEAQARVDAVREASRPQATPWVQPKPGPNLLDRS